MVEPTEEALMANQNNLLHLDPPSNTELALFFTDEALAKEEVAAPSSTTLDGLAPVDGLEVSKGGTVFKITLNRPSRSNSLTLDMYKGIIAALGTSNKDTSTSVTLITAIGDYFCSGNDLKNFAPLNKKESHLIAEEAVVTLQQYVQAYIDHQKPLIGVINGPAVGTAVTATFNASFPALGQSLDGASSYTFPLLMGQLRAANVLLFGKKLTAHDALEHNLISQVVQNDELLRATEKMLKDFSNLPPETLRVNKKLLRDIHRDALTKANEEECRTLLRRWQSKEFAQDCASFSNRSKQNK